MIDDGGPAFPVTGTCGYDPEYERKMSSRAKELPELTGLERLGLLGVVHG